MGAHTGPQRLQRECNSVEQMKCRREGKALPPGRVPPAHEMTREGDLLVVSRGILWTVPVPAVQSPSPRSADSPGGAMTSTLFDLTGRVALVSGAAQGL